MFDFTKCTAQELDLYFDVYTSMLQPFAQLTAHPEEKGSAKHVSDAYKFGFILQEMSRLKDEIKVRETGEPKFSIEELYKLGGQYDHFLVFSILDNTTSI